MRGGRFFLTGKEEGLTREASTGAGEEQGAERGGAEEIRDAQEEGEEQEDISCEADLSTPGVSAKMSFYRSGFGCEVDGRPSVVQHTAVLLEPL